MKQIPDYKIYSLGENALTIDFGNRISTDLNDIVSDLSKLFEEKPFEGFIECVPAYSSLSVFYDLFMVREHFPDFPTARDAVTNQFVKRLQKLSDFTHQPPQVLEIPVSFAKKYSLDLDYVAEKNGISPSEVIEIFLAKTYRVFMLGFLPGFAYLGELDKRIATPRKNSPRTKIPRGSVGIAGLQTGIYPLESPGGWQIIGQTQEIIFDPEKQDPVLFQTGDLVQFIKT
jgi:inhibitor of KinA